MLLIGDTMNYYNEIKYKLLECEVYDKVKDYLKDRNKVNTYFEIDETFEKFERELDNGYFENLLREIFFENEILKDTIYNGIKQHQAIRNKSNKRYPRAVN